MIYSTIEELNNKIFHFYYDNSGKKNVQIVSDFKPMLGMECGNKVTGWKTLKINGIEKNLELIEFPSIGEFKNHIYNNTNLKLYNNIGAIYQFIRKTYPNEIDLSNLKHIKSMWIDIEVHSEDGFPDPEVAAWPITSITVKDNQTQKFYTMATKDYDKCKSILGIPLQYISFKKCKDDKEILQWLIKILKTIKPDVLGGWNSNGFDIPYIINRFDYLYDEDEKLNLSSIKHYNAVSTRMTIKKIQGRTLKTYHNKIAGIVLLDYMELYKKFTFKPRDNYSLAYISECELGTTKIDYSAYDNLHGLWNKNPQLYIDYNIYDVELIDLLDKKLGLVNLAYTIAYDAKCNPVDVLGTTRVWDAIYYNELNDNKIMIPPMKENEKDNFAGAYVKDPVPGIYKWVSSFDLNSLYPHEKMQHNISPECLVYDVSENVGIDHISDRLLNKEIEVNPNYILAGNGCYFRKDVEGFMPRVLKRKYDERKKVKKEMLAQKQILVNIKEEMKRRGLKV